MSYPALDIYSIQTRRKQNQLSYIKHREVRKEKNKKTYREKYPNRTWTDRKDNPKYLENHFKRIRDNLFKSWVMWCHHK